MKAFRIFIPILPFLILFACSDDDQDIPVAQAENEVNQFIWDAMNQWYYWQPDVPGLDDRRRGTVELANELDQYPSPEVLFEDLLYSGDRFSWIVRDYIALENSFQGISKSFGYEYGLVSIDNSDKIIGYVQYVVPGSPADNAGLKRGDLFNKVDDIELTENNYFDLLSQRESYKLSFIDLDNNQLTELDRTVSMSSVELTENPILLDTVLLFDHSKIGYLVYNQFVNNDDEHRALNIVFRDFQLEGISDLVLDLRFNRGGSVTTTQILASMIYGAGTSNTLFGSITYSDKLVRLDPEGFDIKFNFLDAFNTSTGVEPLNRLSIDRIYILTSTSTASASELIISGLIPYLDVTLIGEKTVGKNVASATLYDSESTFYTQKENINPNHTYAIQPIVARVANSDGLTDYEAGFSPDIEIREIDHLEELKPLGDPDEALLSAALEVISMSARSSRGPITSNKLLHNSRDENPILATILLD